MAPASVRKSYSDLIRLIEDLNQTDAEGNSPGANGFFVRSPFGGGTLYSGETGRSIARCARAALRHLAEQDREPWKQPRQERAASTRPIALSIDATLQLYIDPDGKIQPGKDFFLDSFLPVLSGKEVQRIRICPMCSRLFVAIRIDQQCCSDKCNNLRWTHKLRGKLREEKQS